MQCPKCGCGSRVLDTRTLNAGRRRRRHECIKCDHRYSTQELLSEEFDTMTEKCTEFDRIEESYHEALRKVAELSEIKRKFNRLMKVYKNITETKNG